MSYGAARAWSLACVGCSATAPALAKGDPAATDRVYDETLVGAIWREVYRGDGGADRWKREASDWPKPQLSPSAEGFRLSE